MTREELRQWASMRRHFDATREQHAVVAAVIELLDRVEQVEAVIGEQRHIVDFHVTEFGLQHPIECRDDLLGCPVGRALNALDGPPMPVGRYVVVLGDDGALAFEELA